MKALKDHADKLGVKTMLSTPAKALIANDKGAIVGVVAHSEDDEADITINAKAVILASGSFGENKKFIREWAVRDPDHWKASLPINKTGDGILMALDKGAQRGPVSFIGHLGTEGKGIGFASQFTPPAGSPPPSGSTLTATVSLTKMFRCPSARLPTSFTRNMVIMPGRFSMKARLIT